MKFFSVRDLRTSSKMIWQTLETEKEIIITNNGKPTALMLPISNDTFDEVMRTVRSMNALWAMRRMQEEAKSAGIENMSLDEINEIIAAARADRAARMERSA